MKIRCQTLIRSSILMSGMLCVVSSAQAQGAEGLPPGFVEQSIWQQMYHCALFGLLGILLVTFGFKIFDKIITRIDLEEEILKGNMSAAILSAAAIIAIGIIVASAIH